MLELFGLFTSALVSATVLPGTSEAVLTGLMAFKAAPTVTLVVVATVGNVAGSLINWLLGYYARSLENHPRFPVKKADMIRYEAMYAKYGRWSLFAAWVPLLGDPLTIAAGLARTPLIWFIPVVALAKGARYVAVAAIASQVF